MPTEAQINANRENGKKSTGPRTPEGKMRVARNAIKNGLYTSANFYLPDQEEIYIEFCAGLRTQLAPANPVEEIAVDELIQAAWRMRRCNLFEAGAPDDDDDPLMTGDQATIDRARATANRIFHKQLAELRRLQAERLAQAQIEAETPEAVPEDVGAAEISEIAKRIAQFTKQSQFQPKSIARNADCPCGSGRKFKRCCGEQAPPILNDLPKAA